MSQFWGTVLLAVKILSGVAQALVVPEELNNKMWTERHELQRGLSRITVWTTCPVDSSKIYS